MKKLILFLTGIFSVLIVSAQITKLHENVSEVHVIDGKVVFLKEIPAPEKYSMAANFQKMKDWAREEYGKDPFISSVRYDSKRYEIIAKSRIELLLPADSKNVREKFIMRYRVNGYIFNDRCVLEITDISYMYQKVSGDTSKSLPRAVKAEEFITDQVIAKDDELTEIKTNLRKSTLQFINQINKNFEVVFGYMPTFYDQK